MKRVVWAGALALPLAGLALLLAAPDLDVVWEHHPAHFWLVLGAAAASIALGITTGGWARRRGDARLFLASLAFVSAAGFLGLHALATPGVLLETPNQGFVVATPVGLVLAAAFAAASALELSTESSIRLMRWSGPMLVALLTLLAAWAGVSVLELPPLDRPLRPDEAEDRVYALAVPGILLYALAAFRYLPLLRRRRSELLAALVTAFILLAEAMLAVAVARNWHATWWEWHLLMLAAFGLVTAAAWRAGSRERYASLYLEGTRGSVRDVSVVFADLAAYTTHSEREGEEAAAAVVHAYADAIAPESLDPEWGSIGDAFMLVFNRDGRQPDHALRAVRAALELQRRAAGVAAAHPEWPQLRAAVNTGPARVGIVGAHAFTPLGDAVNLAARLEGHANVGEVVVGDATYGALPDGTRVRPLGAIRVKGREAPVEAYVLLGLPDEGQGERELPGDGHQPHDDGEAREPGGVRSELRDDRRARGGTEEERKHDGGSEERPRRVEP